MESLSLPKGHEIYPAKEGDVATIKEMIGLLAKHEGREKDFQATDEDLLKYLFGAKKIATAEFYAIDGVVVGLMIYYLVFHTFKAKPCLFIEDIVVREECRGKGVGGNMMKYLAGVAKSKECNSMDWGVVKWNDSGIKFYEKLGAEQEQGHFAYTIYGENFEKLAKF